MAECVLEFKWCASACSGGGGVGGAGGLGEGVLRGGGGGRQTDNLLDAKSSLPLRKGVSVDSS